MKLYIRTEANAITAGGHMMRCLAIAAEVKKLGEECVFITAEEGSAEMPRKQGFETIVLNRDFTDFDGEIPVMKKLIKERGTERLLTDSYYVTDTYMKEIGKECATAYIDDLHERIWECSYIINYSVYADRYDYENEYRDRVKLLGCDYVPLRSIYRDLPPKEIKDRVQKILVLTGAADPEHFLLNLAEHVKDAGDGFEYTMIAGRFNPDIRELEKIAGEAANIRLLGPQPDLLWQLTEADLVITAGGVTMYETAAAGTPGISYMSADNQRGNAEGFDRLGLIPFSGDIRKDYSYEGLLDLCTGLSEDPERRKRISASMQKLADGHGAERIARILTGALG